MKTVLLLGAGFVARPLVRYLLDQKDIKLLVASIPVQRARELVAGHPRGQVFELNVNDEPALTPLMQAADLVVSLLPYKFHVSIARLCLQHRKHLITASYLTREMQALDAEARQKDVLLLNETGLDPGIDHMSAMQIRDDVIRRGGRVVSFESCCGGLPAPEANDNPFGYKFSWSPRGVLLAGRNSASYRKDGRLVNVAGEKLFQHHWLKKVGRLGDLEVYPNRHSLVYEQWYDMPGTETFFRGTFRYPGWSETIDKIIELGFLCEEENASLSDMTYTEMMATLIGKRGKALRKDVADYLHLPADSPILDRLQWLGLFSDEKIAKVRPTPIDILTDLMLQKMSYRPGERDMVVLQHDFIVQFAQQREHIRSLLLDYGQPDGDSSMARTVSLPTAIAAKLIVHDKVNLRGVQIPVDAEIYEPVLHELETLGIRFEESRRAL